MMVNSPHESAALSADALQRAEALLRDVLRLTRDVIDMKRLWSATDDDVRLMFEVAVSTGQSLPAQAFKSANVALGFLLMAKLSLESMARGIRDAPSS